jgi:hypothetical protein
MKLPQAKNENIIVQNLNDEVLIYDSSNNRAFCLNSTSANVFNHCDGATTFKDLEQRYGYSEDLIYLTLDTLAQEKLIVGDYQSKLAGISRREAIRKVGLATMIALPLVSSLAAPKAANAASRAAVNQCQTNGCVDGNQQCNPGAGCGALGGNFVCCASGNTCFCVPAAVCTGNGGQVCTSPR